MTFSPGSAGAIFLGAIVLVKVACSCGHVGLADAATAARAAVLAMRLEPLRRGRRADHEQGRRPVAPRCARVPAGHRKKTVGVTPSTVAKRCSVTAVGFRCPASRALTYER
jgi:hypothetical protein